MQHRSQKIKQRTPFLKLYTDDWIAGTIDLSFEEKGFYFELLLRMWERKDVLPNDERWIAGALGCNPRTVRKLLSALVDAGKLYIEDGMVGNFRMMREISTHLAKSDGQSDANSAPIHGEFGSNSSRTAAKNTTKSKAENSLPYSRSQKPEKKGTPPVAPPHAEAMPSAAPPAPPVPAKRGSRLADDWSLPDDWRQWTLTNCLGSRADTVSIEAAKFANHWHAKPGREACKLDWRLTWMNWCYRAFGTAPLRPHASPPPQAKRTFAQAMADRAAAAGVQA